MMTTVCYLSWQDLVYADAGNTLLTYHTFNTEPYIQYRILLKLLVTQFEAFLSAKATRNLG